MLYLAGRLVRTSRALYAGAFVSVALGAFMIGLAANAIAAGEAYRSAHSGGLEVVVSGGGVARHTVGYVSSDETPEGLQAVLGFVATLGGFMTAFLVASTFAFVVASRRRDLGLLALVGATPKQIRRLVLGEALTVATVGSAVGCLGAYAATPVLLEVAAGTEFSPMHLEPSSPWLPLTIAFGTGVVVAVIGAYFAARRAANLAPVDALRDAAVERTRLTIIRVLVGLGSVAGAVAAMSVMTPGDLELAMAAGIFVPQLLVIAFVALAPVLVPALTRVAGALAERMGGVGAHLAANSVRATPRRSTSLMSPIVAITAIAGSMLMVLSIAAAADESVRAETIDAPIVIESATRADLHRIESAPGVGAVDWSTTVEVVRTDRGYANGTVGAGVDPRTFTRARDLDGVSGSLERLRGNTIAMTRMEVAGEHYRIGDRVRVAFADGSTQRLRLVAVVPDAAGLVPDVMIPRRLAIQHAATAMDGEVLVVPDAGASTLEALGDLRDRLAGTGATARPTGDWLAEMTADTRAQNGEALLLVLGPAGLYAAIAIVNTMLMDGTRRRRELATGELVGATPRQLMRAVVGEATLVSGIALAIGFGIAASVSYLVWTAVSRSADDVALVIAWPTLAAIGAVAGVLAIAGAVIPATVTLRSIGSAGSLGTI
ncbi:ABC transporter permease [Nocardioidaceae bacterium SCSIO 66511]|nr:ABC transporter permease [Nocardioidaceae bacterium SCSIO 66511]